MTTPTIIEVLRALEKITSASEVSLVQRGCLNWLSQVPYEPIFRGISIEVEVESDYKALAYLGYGGSSPGGERLVDPIFKGCQWLVGRDITRTTGELQTFALDPVGLLGIMLGTQTFCDAKAKESVLNRISDCLTAADSSFAKDTTKSAFADACKSKLEEKVYQSGASSSAVLYVLLRRLGAETSQALSEQSLAECLSAVERDNVQGFEAGLYLCSLKCLLEQAPQVSIISPTVEQVLGVLRGVEAGMFRWPYGRNKTQVWEIENEYDVQSLLYFLLRPIFPELKEEEPMGSIGRKRPRIDLVIPSLRLVIEVKFLRPAARFNDILGEVAEDKSFYLGPSSSFAHMVVFLWDDSSRTEEHSLFESGVKELGIDGGVVVSRPSFMTRHVAKPASKVV